MEKSEADAIVQALGAGNAILILGDLSDVYDSTPSLDVLRQEVLSALGFNASGTARLSEALRALRSKDSATANSLVRAHLAHGLNDYRSLVRIIQAPWDRVYSIGGLYLEPIRFERLSVQIQRISADDPVPTDLGKTLLVDEAIAADHALISFAAHRPGMQRGLWRGELDARTLRRPVVVVAKAGHELLWDSLGEREPTSKTPCFVVLETVSPEDEVSALNLAASIVQGSLEDLAQALPSGNERLQTAKRQLARSRNSVSDGVGVRLVSSFLRESRVSTDWRFLRGFDPEWSDVVDGLLLSLPILRTLRREALTGDQRNIVVVKGRAGAGKTAALMQFANELTTQSALIVAWIDRAATHSMAKLIEEVIALEPDCVMVDDVDIFGESARGLLRDLNRGGRTLVVASVRTTRESTLGSTLNTAVVEEAPLSDNDIKKLERLLGNAGLLGSLQGVEPRQTRLDRIRQICKRDLLAALIQIVTGQKFEDRIRSEFEQLPREEQSLYLTLAIVFSHINESKRVTEEDLIQSARNGWGPSVVSDALDSLILKKLVVVDEMGIGVRHRAIADALIEQLPREVVAAAIGSLLRYFAGRSYAIADSSHPDRRTMIALLSHSLMGRRLNLPAESVREIYASVGTLLEADFHYWLQRGAYEVERGDLELARSYLDAARSCPGGINDYKVTTEWGLLRLLRARRSPTNPTFAQEAGEAIREMIRVAKTHGASSPHTYRVLASDGDEFLSETSHLSKALISSLRDELDSVVSVGLSACRDNMIAMEALEGYGRRRNVVARTASPSGTAFPMPKPSVFARRR